TAYTIMGYLPEIKTANRKQLAALVGVAPYNRDSGKQKGKRFIYGCRSQFETFTGNEGVLPTLKT
ncbi:transposase, partial [Thiotrichales bacterium 19X7-9]|nr:transposase [Thiotrichales bacterium 19X7-9]